jgi:GNAT superfamily N-acetyltransferase
VATALLEAAIAAAREDGATVLEGYPVVSAGRQAAAFVWTGTVPLFEKFGFRRVDDKSSGKVRVRLAL